MQDISVKIVPFQRSWFVDVTAPFSYHDKKYAQSRSVKIKTARSIMFLSGLLCRYTRKCDMRLFSLHLFLVRFRLKSTYRVYSHASERSEATVKFRQRYFSYWYSNDHSWKRICINVYNIGRWYAKRVKRWCMFRYIRWYLTATVTLREVIVRDSRQVGKKRENARLTYHRTNCPRDFATPPDNL